MPTIQKSKSKSKHTPKTKNLELRHIEGNTCSHNRQFTHNPVSPLVAYAASSIAVLYNYETEAYLYCHSNTSNPVSCLNFSADGKYLAVGTSGHQPSVSIYESQTGLKITSFKTHHSFGIACLSFGGEDQQFLCTLGFKDDSLLLVWDWNKIQQQPDNRSSYFLPVGGVQLTSNTFSLCSVSPSQSLFSFAVCGEKHITVFSLPSSSSSSEPPLVLETLAIEKGAQDKKDIEKKTVSVCTLQAQSIGLGVFCDATFIDLEYGNDRIYAVTSSGALVWGGTELGNCVELKTPHAYGVTLSKDYVCCGCSDSTIRLFDIDSLTYVATIPRSHAIGSETKFIESHKPTSARQKGKVYPDVACVRMSPNSNYVCCIYSDRSMMVWDISSTKSIVNKKFWYPHSGCIWGIESCHISESSLPQDEKKKAITAGASLVTCSSDGTLRFWKYNRQNPSPFECVGVLPLTKDARSLSKPSISDHLVRLEVPTVKERRGLRCLTANEDGSQLAIGDTSGNVHLLSLPSGDALCTIPAHDGEVLQLDYISLQQQDNSQSPNKEFNLLASSSRDRLVHVYDTSDAQKFKLLATLDDHSASVTCMKMLPGEKKTEAKIISAAADKSLLFRTVSIDKSSKFSFNRYRHLQVPSSISFLQPNLKGDNEKPEVMAVCKDKKASIRYYDLQSGKDLRVKQAPSSVSQVMKVMQDQAGITTVMSMSDRSILLTNTDSSKSVVGVARGHSELVTGMTYSPDHQLLLTTSADGCIFSWEVPDAITSSIESSLESTVTSKKLELLPSPSSTKEKPENREPIDQILSSRNEEEGSADRTSGVSIDDLFLGGNAGTVPSWLGGEPASKSSIWDQPIGDEGNEWNEKIQEDRDVFSAFDFAPSKGRRYTIEPSDDGMGASSASDRESDDSHDDPAGGFFGSFENSSSSQSRRMSISSIHNKAKTPPLEKPPAVLNSWKVDAEEEAELPQDEEVPPPSPSEEIKVEQSLPEQKNHQDDSPEQIESPEKNQSDSPIIISRKETVEQIQSEIKEAETQKLDTNDEAETKTTNQSEQDEDVEKNQTDLTADPNDPKTQYELQVQQTRERLRRLGLLSGSSKPKEQTQTSQASPPTIAQGQKLTRHSFPSSSCNHDEEKSPASLPNKNPQPISPVSEVQTVQTALATALGSFRTLSPQTSDYEQCVSLLRSMQIQLNLALGPIDDSTSREPSLAKTSAEETKQEKKSSDGEKKAAGEKENLQNDTRRIAESNINSNETQTDLSYTDTFIQMASLLQSGELQIIRKTPPSSVSSTSSNPATIEKAKRRKSVSVNKPHRMSIPAQTQRATKSIKKTKAAGDL